MFSDEGLQRLPAEVRQLTTGGELALDRWSLDALNVPIYPQWRFQWGVVEWLRRRCSAEHVLEIVLVQPGRRVQVDVQTERISGEQFAERRSEFLFNVHPR